LSLSQYADSAASKVASAATFGGSAVSVYGGINGWLNSLNWNAVATMGGLVLGVAGFALNWFYKERHYRIALQNKKPDLEV